jgi:selenocysteine-specific elongation factor
VQRAADRVLASDVVEERSRALVALVAAHHAAEPLADGVPREDARARICGRAEPAVFEHIVGRLVSAGTLVARERLALPTHAVSFQGEDARVAGVLIEAVRSAGLTPPDLAEVAAKAGASASAVERIAGVLVRQGRLARLDGVHFHPETLDRLKADMRGLKAEAAGGRATVDVAAFKARYGMTRKFAIPLLEFLDRERVTRRMGDVRVVL